MVGGRWQAGPGSGRPRSVVAGRGAWCHRWFSQPVPSVSAPKGAKETAYPCYFTNLLGLPRGPVPPKGLNRPRNRRIDIPFRPGFAYHRAGWRVTGDGKGSFSPVKRHLSPLHKPNHGGDA